MRIFALIGFVVAALMSQSAAQENYPVEFFDVEVVKTYPHDTDAFTQGLFVRDGILYETTGQYGQSRLRRVDLETGQAAHEVALPEQYFGEGSTIVGDEIFVLSWQAGDVLRYHAETFELTSTNSYPGEGWGLTYDGDRLIMSDGTSELRFVDPENFQEVSRITVTYRGKPVPRLNELEWVDGSIYANIWQAEIIVRIDPETGAVTGVIEMRDLLTENDIVPGQTDVLNGIAFDDEAQRLYVTGKYWPKLFEVRFQPRVTAP